MATKKRKYELIFEQPLSQGCALPSHLEAALTHLIDVTFTLPYI